MIVVKLSYTILWAWSQYKYEDAVSYYLNRDLPLTKEIELGRLKHARWAMYTMQHKKLHADLGGDKLTDPVVEQKYEKLIPLGDKYIILLRGIPDCTDGPICYEYKCGSKTAVEYIDDLQLDYMKLLNPELKEGRYICYNPYFKRKTVGIKYLTEDNAMTALEHVVTFGGEIIEYLQSQRMLVNYKHGQYEPAQQAALALGVA